MKKKFMIYKYTSPSGGVYIGQTCAGKLSYRQGVDGSKYLQVDKTTGEYLQPAIARAIIKYGFDNFKKDILFEGLSSEEADEKEIELIKYYKENGECYNVTSGGKGVPDVNYTKIKQYTLSGEFVKGWDSIEEAAVSLGNKQYGSNISACCAGKKHRAYGFIWRYADDNSIVEPLSPYRENICQLTKDGKYVATYNSVKYASKMTGIKERTISNALEGRWAKTAGGYIWRFERFIKK